MLHTYLHVTFSCLAYPDSLDTPCRHRSAAHTDVLLGLHDEETLRTAYGIAPDAAVRIKHNKMTLNSKFSALHIILPSRGHLQADDR